MSDARRLSATNFNDRVAVVEECRRLGLSPTVWVCPRCNGRLVAVEKAEIEALLEPLTRAYFHEFKRCPDCLQIYWKGSHYEQMQQTFKRL